MAILTPFTKTICRRTGLSYFATVELDSYQSHCDAASNALLGIWDVPRVDALYSLQNIHSRSALHSLNIWFFSPHFLHLFDLTQSPKHITAMWPNLRHLKKHVLSLLNLAIASTLNAAFAGKLIVTTSGLPYLFLSYLITDSWKSSGPNLADINLGPNVVQLSAKCISSGFDLPDKIGICHTFLEKMSNSGRRLLLNYVL